MGSRGVRLVLVAALAIGAEGFSLASLSAALHAGGRRSPSLMGAAAVSCSTPTMPRPRTAAKAVVLPAQGRARRPNGYWKEYENVEAEILQLVDKLELDGVMPTEAQLRANSLSSLSDALQKDLGGFAAVAARLGLKCSKPRGFWKDFDNVVGELKAWMEGTRCTTLPTQAELRAAGRTDLISAMQQHGGMVAFAEHLGVPMAAPKGKRATGFSVRKQLEEHIAEFVAEHGLEGVFPSNHLLTNWGRSDLVRGIERHGGPEHMAKKCGLEIRRAPAALSEVAQDLYDEARNLGHSDVMPSLDDLRGRGRGDLASVVEAHGGVHAAACMVGMRSAHATVKGRAAPGDAAAAGPGGARFAAALRTARRQLEGADRVARGASSRAVRAMYSPQPSGGAAAARRGVEQGAQKALNAVSGRDGGGDVDAMRAKMRARLSQR
eukprot:CAMPEP_0174923502 /NCGR_PEP_ID=MMETSP1355-20121228/6627_1 /TAXON_ID=464990 /ORGANISM="Hemiselmis tepida, Strain CCMP443" /LENGTH=435 /DNA_ID=CAMNT_0016169195 /DNA_START=1 /DNA_END=1305 /DNA_ORIENTATION=-